ncbi:6-hydroxy-D-nicotine oxidase [Diplonema papillatum]|nr:6-hydroxy-D-nicotine oxidase [Diplonema papillatum]
MWSRLVAVVAVLGLQAEAAAKNPVSNAGMCKLAKTLDGKVLLATATCCVGYARPMNYLCPANTGDETYAKTTKQYLMDCDGEIPDGVIIAKGPGDVSKALAYAKAANVAFRVKSGGHSQACLSTVKDGVVLSLESMKKVEYINHDDGSVFVTIEAGVTLTELRADYTANSDVYFPHGLDPWIGAGGHFTGGGVGHLVRKFGFGTDFVVGMDVVLPSGEFVQVFEPEYEERLTGRLSVYNERDRQLLWGLKGSGHANFGVVTKFWMRTIPRPAYVVLGKYSYNIADKTSVEEYWNSMCGYYSKAPEDETAGERNLLVWPMVSNNREGPGFLMRFIIYYIPDNNSTAQGALNEATPVVNAFLTHVKGLTYHSGGIEAVAESGQFPNLVDPSASRYAPTCVSRIVPSREDVCNRDGWIGKFADFIYDEITAFPSRGTTLFTYFDKWGGAASLNDADFERTSVSTRNAYGTIQFCRIPLNVATRDTNAMINGEGGTKDFNDSVLADVGNGWYLNFLDTLATEPEQIYTEPAVYQRLQKVKNVYDPTNVLDRPLGVPLPGSEFLADSTLALVGASAPTVTDYCALSGALEGAVLMPAMGCCGTSAVPPGFPCAADPANGNLSYAESHNRVLVDCDDLKPNAVIIARSALDVTKSLKFIKERDIDYRIRSGAHSQSCASTCSNCVVISLEKMKGIDYVTSDTGATFMGVEPGVVLKELIADYQDHSDVYFPHGLDAPVGLGGHLGGGAVGYLTRKFGFGADFIVGVELVLGNGKFVQVYDQDYEEQLLGYRRAHNDEDQDLLWAVKGNAHANVGVVTRYWMRTIPRPSYMVKGFYLFGAQSAAHLQSFWGSVCKFYSVDDESPKAKNLIMWPFVRSGNQLMLQVYYLPDRNDTASGALAEAAEVLNEFLVGVTAPLITQSIQAVPDKMQFDNILNDQGGRTTYSCTSRLVRKREDVCNNWAFLDSFADRMWYEMENPVEDQTFFAYFDPWGGAATTNDPDFVKSSFMGRHAWGTFQYCRTPVGDVTRETLWATVDKFDSLIASQISDSWYVNFQDRTTTNRSQVLFVPEVNERLQTIKAKYDATGVFSSPLTVTLPERGW